ncbi:MAG: DUF2795 domain-containing protein [Nitrososphaeraceae archaeon]
MGQLLKDLDFPANKEKIVDFVKTNTTAKDLLEKLEKLPEKKYKNLSEVTYETGLVY